MTISSIPPPAKPSTSEKLEELLRRKKRTEQAIERCSLANKSLHGYLGTLNVKDVGTAEVAVVVKTWQTTAEDIDNQVDELRAELGNIDSQLSTEQSRLAGPAENQDLRMKVALGVFADAEEEAEIRLVYGTNIFAVTQYACLIPTRSCWQSPLECPLRHSSGYAC